MYVLATVDKKICYTFKITQHYNYTYLDKHMHMYVGIVGMVGYAM